MKRIFSFLLSCLLLTGCGQQNPVPDTESTLPVQKTEQVSANPAEEIPFQSRFSTVTEIFLPDEEILTDSDAVTVSHDIIYYEDRDAYDSGNPYGEGTTEERHSPEEAAEHTVVTITKPGAYRVSGKLSKGQIRIDLGDDAYEEETAVVELILDNADITCTVAPAILFLNTYECDGDWSTETARPEVDTTDAGANLILEGSNKVSGSHVAKIFKDKDEEKKLWKQDGAIYSYQSLNVYGPGSLELTADNEGLDTELHLTINGGNIHIYSGNDGINTNEDGVSVTTMNAGSLTIFAGLGEEGDGIDSNGYLVINGGSVVSAANPASDAGLDSDLGSFVNGGTVIAMGSAMDWAESDSEQVTMNLQFAEAQKAGSKITITREDGTEIFSFESNSEYARPFSGLILSHAYFTQGATYHVYVDGVQMAYTGNDVGHGGKMPMGERPDMPEGLEFSEGQRPAMPEGMDPGEPPEGFDPSQMGGRGPRPEGFEGERPEMPDRGFGSMENMPGNARTNFYMNDNVNAFSGVHAV